MVINQDYNIKNVLKYKQKSSNRRNVMSVDINKKKDFNKAPHSQFYFITLFQLMKENF